MNDHRLIGWQKEPWLRFRPQEAALLHHQSKAHLADVLGDGVHRSHRCHQPPRRPLGITSSAVPDRSRHRCFSFRSIRADRGASAQPALWVHGHVHNSSDYRAGSTCIVCNPHGYGSENPDFDGALVVEVGESSYLDVPPCVPLPRSSHILFI